MHRRRDGVDVRFWHEGDIEELTTLSAFGGKAGLSENAAQVCF
jgi:hypothetical protein